jgi:hypothetical protein
VRVDILLTFGKRLLDGRILSKREGLGHKTSILFIDVRVPSQ